MSTDGLSLADKIVALHRDLAEVRVPHAFGGALALAWCTQRARATIDIDVNLFVDFAEYESVLGQLPAGIACTDANREEIARDGQSRLWWGHTPVDVFFNTTEFHTEAATRARVEEFAGEHVPFLACPDLAVFKAFFNRTKDWADLEEMQSAGSLDHERVVAVLLRFLGPDDERIARLLDMRG